ncbi:hypothetical protein Pint_07439 [Pistacia integerrima]|uniref:Uncharacterized protein n=1 Tax=Pistacia integerrima TaxID=434235 RepID=A0ACC0XX52_9ROSI|nr:hypothetical protein Pint_07439 [Pistacia integerrima]
MVRPLLCWFVLVAVVFSGSARGSQVTYDGRSLIIDGQRKILFSGSIHYPRSPLETWASLISKAKDGGLDVIQTYVFWNLHEPQPGQYDFSGRKDLVKFIKEIQAQGLYASLRIGPFIESEWSYGGLPFWLRDIPGITFRCDNEPFKIENEYSMVEAAFKERGPPYVKWAAEMAAGLQTGVPWVMCKQDDAPDPVTFVGPNSPNKPSIWTENWTSQYQVYGEEPLLRSPEDIAFHVALWIARNGSFVNYYMYHGGTNFGRVASAFVITSYYDQAPLDEYGMIRQPKWGHLKELHAAIKHCSINLLRGQQTIYSLGDKREAYVFRLNSRKCAAFLVNRGGKDTEVSTQNSSRSMIRGKILDGWEEFIDHIPNYEDTTLKSNTLLEQITTARDSSDYLWYNFRYQHQSSNTKALLKVYSLGHVLHAFVNGVLAGSAHGTHQNPRFTLENTVSLNNGINNISLLSVMVGLPDSGAFMETKGLGLRSVSLQVQQKQLILTNSSWGYQAGLLGENLQIYTDQGSSKVQWNKFSSSRQPLSWYKTVFDAPAGDEPIALNFGLMGKGEAWVNGESIGRYWVSFHTPNGIPSQTWYHVPRSFLKPTGNLLVILEEEGRGSPLSISLDTASITRV